MTFNIHQIDKLDYANDEDADEKFNAYRDKLLQLFSDSPEYKRHTQKYPDTGWADSLMDFGFRYLGYSVPTLNAIAIDELITDILPRKVSLQSRKDALDAIPELVAFWSFLKREYNLRNADSILTYLASCSPDKFADSMFNPAKAGMAKSFFMSGQMAGFDMTDMKQANQYMAIYNEKLSLDMEQGNSQAEVSEFTRYSPFISMPLSEQEQKAKKADEAKEKKKRKAEKAARKRNRKR